MDGDKRPRFAVGDTVRVTLAGNYAGWQGTVTGISPLHNVDGSLVTYFYTVRMERLGEQEWAEDHLGTFLA